MARARQHVEEALLAKAGEDAAFRTLLLSDPRAALKQLLGVDPIPSLKIRIIEEQAGEVTLVLPRAIAQDELPDEILDYAAGGNAQECWNQFKNDWLFGRFDKKK
uniref:NHLP leader peptide family RiPP precursor n=2 Tax=Stappiaceae TaxID=2821832 RepID=UPI0009E2AAC3|nr:NHLP leader peptide family RiPP precursor [Pannonibacter phragmitetus]